MSRAASFTRRRIQQPQMRKIDLAIRNGERHLAKMDAVMKRLIAKHGHCPLAGRAYQPFHMLANSIISQQLSTKAANAIKRRIAELVASPFHPREILSVSNESLRAAGLSHAKASHLREIATRLLDGRFSFDDLAASSDEFVIESLVELPGVGRWTAEMFLIFGLKRLDVLAIGDAGLQRAARNLYSRRQNTENLLQQVAEPWRPYRSVASWYLWRSLDDAG